MKFLVIAASAFAFAATPALAGGWGGHNYGGSPQFAHSSALNLAKQVGTINAGFSKGSVNQVTGAAAEAINKSKCGCKGDQTAKAMSKNISFQVGTINAGKSIGSVDQSAISTSLAKNVRGY